MVGFQWCMRDYDHLKYYLVVIPWVYRDGSNGAYDRGKNQHQLGIWVLRVPCSPSLK